MQKKNAPQKYPKIPGQRTEVSAKPADVLSFFFFFLPAIFCVRTGCQRRVDELCHTLGEVSPTHCVLSSLPPHFIFYHKGGLKTVAYKQTPLTGKQYRECSTLRENLSLVKKGVFFFIKAALKGSGRFMSIPSVVQKALVNIESDPRFPKKRGPDCRHNSKREYRVNLLRKKIPPVLLFFPIIIAPSSLPSSVRPKTFLVTIKYKQNQRFFFNRQHILPLHGKKRG